MRNLMLAVVFALMVVSPIFAQIAEDNANSIPGQIMGVEVTSGHHIPGFIVLKGEVQIFQGAAARKCTVFVNDFSTKVTPAGKWAIAIPKSSLYLKKGMKIQVQAFQEQLNLMYLCEFDLSNLDDKIEQNNNFNKLYND